MLPICFVKLLGSSYGIDSHRIFISSYFLILVPLGIHYMFGNDVMLRREEKLSSQIKGYRDGSGSQAVVLLLNFGYYLFYCYDCGMVDFDSV